MEVFLDGRSLGVHLTPPYRFALVPEILSPEGSFVEKSAQRPLSVHSLAIEVTNTVVKAQHQNPFDPYFVQDPTGIVGQVSLKYHKKQPFPHKTSPL